ncbi:TPA: hypothetical protein ACTXAM_000252 [Raoultella ornithinolytica]|uniref:hypothetical protein n=1 Tax=Raoultella ornithinolytica TaxID=54291 RepID=UPI0004D67BE0|nr:hypothetical protein [Raoultella ornithinolytica]KDV93012.1 polysaccharide biosynthesis family protein [Raoultella ornithinolytica 2-156-04_S1_C1]KDX13255.1 polysaccharide biosynthesis family protein [Raoultella ornithinolytica 2-156-04_S1_C2]
MKRIFLLLVRIFYSSISLIFTLITARILTRDDYKQSVELIVALSIMAPIVSFGIGPLVVRKGNCSTKSLYRRALNGWILGGGISLVLGFISYWLYPDIYIYIFFFLLLNNTSFIISECYRSQNDFFRALLYSNGSPSSGVISLGIISNAIFLIICCVLLALKLNISFSLVVWITIGSILLTVIYPFYKNNREWKITLTRKWLISYSKSGFNISLIYFLFSFIANADLLVISHFSEQNIVYDYSLAFKLSASCLIIHTFFASMAQVEFVGNKFSVNSNIKKLYLISVSVSFVVIVLLNLFGYYILHAFGVNPHNIDFFRSVILIKSVGALFYILLGFNASLLLISNKYRYIIAGCLVFLCSYVLLYLFMMSVIRIEQQNAVLYSWLVSYIFYSIILYFYARRKRKYNG